MIWKLLIHINYNIVSRNSNNNNYKINLEKVLVVCCIKLNEEFFKNVFNS